MRPLWLGQRERPQGPKRETEAKIPQLMPDQTRQISEREGSFSSLLNRDRKAFYFKDEQREEDGRSSLKGVPKIWSALYCYYRVERKKGR